MGIRGLNFSNSGLLSAVNFLNKCAWKSAFFVLQVMLSLSEVWSTAYFFGFLFLIFINMIQQEHIDPVGFQRQDVK